MTPTLKIKTLFFDKDIVKNAMTKDEQKLLSKAGAFIWNRERRSLRYVTDKPGKQKRSAPAGAPPLVHKRAGGFTKTRKLKGGGTKTQPASQLRELNFFSYDPTSRSVVVGPVGFGAKPGEVPNLMEFGGTATRRKLKRSSKRSGRSISDAQRAAARRKFLAGEIDGGASDKPQLENFQAKYQPHPWMGPALAAEVAAGTIPALWKNALRG